MDNMKTKHVMNGSHGEVWFNGQYVDEIISCEAKVTFDKQEVIKCRKMGKSYKIVGFEGKGTLKINKVDSMVIKTYEDFIHKDGGQPDITIISKLDDPDAVGMEHIAYKGVVLDEVALANWEAKKLGEESIPFTFEDYEIYDLA